MLLRSSLSVDFWWDANETNNYLTNRMPTKTVNGYMKPHEGVYEEVPDIVNTYIRITINHHRNNWREEVYSCYLIGFVESVVDKTCCHAFR